MGEVPAAAPECETVRNHDTLLHERDEKRIDSIVPNLPLKISECLFPVLLVAGISCKRAGWRERFHGGSADDIPWIALLSFKMTSFNSRTPESKIPKKSQNFGMTRPVFFMYFRYSSPNSAMSISSSFGTRRK